jgi:hypothetical protein
MFFETSDLDALRFLPGRLTLPLKGIVIIVSISKSVVDVRENEPELLRSWVLASGFDFRVDTLAERREPADGGEGIIQRMV